jgi:transcription elongation factor Elf1
MAKGERLELPNRAHLHCPDCGQECVAQLALNADDDVIDCSACGARLATMGEMMERVIRAASERLYAGLQRRRDKLAGR